MPLPSELAKKSAEISDDLIAVLNAHIPGSNALEILCGQLLAIISMGYGAPEPRPPSYQAVLDAADACLKEIAVGLKAMKGQTVRRPVPRQTKTD